jgi:hypothetical protein
MDEALKGKLEPGEALLDSRRLSASMLVLPAFFVLLGLVQFSPWSFGNGAALAGGVAVAYGLFTAFIFIPLYRRGTVGLTDRRVVYLQGLPMGKNDLLGWDRGAFDSVMVRRGVFGGWLGYGHLMLLKSGRLVTVIRSVNGIETLVTRIESDLLGRQRAV